MGRKQGAALAVRPGINGRGAGVWQKIKQNKQLYLIFLLPFLYFVVFRYGAMGWLALAFKDYNAVEGLWGSEWVGLKHFIEFFSMPDFWKLLRNTLLISIYSLIFSFPVPILLALMINEVGCRRFKKVVQSITYLPHFFSTVIICGMLVDFLTRDGMINQIIVALGGEPISFLTDPAWFRTIYIASGIWQGAGWGSIMYLAALNGVDPQLYESAVIDGASRLQMMRHISLPAILPIISIQLLLNIGSMLPKRGEGFAGDGVPYPAGTVGTPERRPFGRSVKSVLEREKATRGRRDFCVETSPPLPGPRPACPCKNAAGVFWGWPPAIFLGRWRGRDARPGSNQTKKERSECSNTNLTRSF